jgi:hypothetical protein
MKTLQLFLVLILILSVSFLFAEVKNVDKPSKGELTFKIEKIWEVDGAGKDSFGRIRRVLVSDDGTVYISDKQVKKNFIFDENGKFIRAFGERGEGPGQIMRTGAQMFFINNKIIVQDYAKLHYFDNQGKYIHSVLNDFEKRRPVFFLNEDVFVSSPRTLLEAADGKGKIFQFNIKTGEQKVMAQFSLFKGGAIKRTGVDAAVAYPSVAPMMIIGHNDDQLFFGKNDVYRIYIANMNGNIINQFSLERETRSITNEEKEERLFRDAKGTQVPKGLIKMMLGKVPNQLTYFTQIEEHKGLIYVFVSEFNRKNIQQVDIFSPKGEYLYRTYVKVAPDNNILIEPIIKKDYLYIAFENENGEHQVGKYKIALPKS